MSEWLELLTLFASKARAMWLGEKFVQSLIALVVCVTVLELLTGRQWRRYLTRTFFTDLCYCLFFAAGFYYFLFSGPIDRLLKGLVRDHTPFLLLDLLGWLPLLPKTIVFIALIDGVEYAMHRLYHRYDWLWCFHCIHHSPRQLTPLTKFRVHFVDMTIFGTVKAIPMMMLGHTGTAWMPILPLMVLQVFSHFDVDVHYGPVLGRILVSPRFHRVHHSSDPVQRDRNFGIVFSFWDYLFGTASRDLTRPREYGVRELQVPEGFLRQFFFPFLLLARRWGQAQVLQPGRAR